jgi:putative oxidoreductase
MNAKNDFAALLGRILLAVLFVPSGFSKITGFSGLVGNIQHAGVPLPEVGAAIAILVELFLGLMILAGWKTRWAALGFLVYLIVITPIFHNFWAAAEADKMDQQINFMKNHGIMAAYLFLFAFGPGRFSVDRG